jgi:hypothetical protein
MRDHALPGPSGMTAATHAPATPAGGPSPARAAVLLVAGLVALQLLLAARVPLVTDEAHYALYGLHLDWSYFDHPPLVGWLQALALAVSDADLALRAWAVLCFAASCALLFRLVRRLFPDASPWAACLAVALWGTAPGVHATGVALVPESALVPLALLVLLALVDVLRWGSLAQWLRLGLWLGLAGLAKYTAFTLAASVLLALLLARRGRDLPAPGPLAAALLAAALVAPVFAWNAAHDWISFRYQLGHGTEGATWEARDFLASRAGELLAFGPALVVGGLLAGWRALRHERHDPGARLCLVFSLPVLALFWWASGRERALPHWTQLGWLGLSVLAARWYLEPGRARRWLLLGGLGYGAAALLLLQLAFVPGLLPGPARAQVTGWKEAARTALSLRDGLAGTPGSEPQLFTDRWTHASRLAFYARPVPVLVIDRRRDQFDLWFGAPSPGARGVLVAWDDEAPPQPDEDLAHFGRHELLRELPIEEHGVRLATFRFWACDDYRP